MADKHFQLCLQVPRPRVTPHFSMRDSSCSCRDVIWEQRVRYYSKVWLGLLAAPAQALLCLQIFYLCQWLLCLYITGRQAWAPLGHNSALPTS